MSGRKCEHVREDGSECRAWALRESDPPRCRIHALTPEQLSAEASRMARRLAAKRRTGVDPAPFADIAPGLSFGDLMRIVAPALEATFPNGSPDYSARLCAAGVVISSFPRYMRSNVADVNALLREVLPDRVYSSERHEADQVYRAMRAEWDRLTGLGWSELGGVVTKPYPAHFIGPHEDARAIQAGRPAPIPPHDPRVLRLPGGGAMLKRDAELPLLLERLQDEGMDEGTIEVDTSVTPGW